jgi:hypothetical protein
MGLHGPQEVLRDVSWDLQPVVVEINDKGHLGNLGFNCFQFSRNRYRGVPVRCRGADEQGLQQVRDG